MKILHVYKDYAPVVGGIENHIRTLAEGQAAAGHEVTVLVTDPGSTTRTEACGGVRVIKAARLACVASTPVSLALFRELRRLVPDVTHLHFPYPLGEVAHHALGRGRRTVLTYHCDIVRQRRLLRLYRPVMTRVLDRADRIIVSSPALLEGCPTLHPFVSKCRVVPHGIVRAPFLVRQPERIRAITAACGDRPIVLFVGVLRYYKGLEYLLQAMRDVPAALLVVGDGPLADRARSLASGLGLADRVVFLGRVPDEDLPACYQAADLFVLPATERAEAFGLAQVEAMTAGLPVISTEVGTGTSFVNAHGRTGLVVPPRDAGALAAAMRLLLSDPVARHRMAAAARARSRSFSAQAMVRQVLEVYGDLGASEPRPAAEPARRGTTHAP